MSLVFAKYKISNDGVKPYSMARVVNYLIYFMDFIGDKPFEKVERKDIEDYLNRRKEMGDSDRYLFALKISIRGFFKWFYKCEDGYPDVVRWMNCKLPQNKKLPEFIEMSEIQRMLERCDNLRDKALVSVLYESGGRISEILDLRIGDVKFDEHGAILYVNMGKTGGRPIRVVKSTNDIKQWINLHPFKDDNNSPLFCSFCHGNYGGFIDTSSGWELIRSIAKRAGIERKIHPHMFRRGRATDLSKVLSDREMKIFFGWSPNSNMPGLYSHLNAKDVDDKILMVNGVKPKDEVKPVNLPTFECHKCGEVNNTSNKFCWKCNTPLDQETIGKLDAVKKIVSEITLYVFEKMREGKVGEDDLEEIVKEWYENKS